MRVLANWLMDSLMLLVVSLIVPGFTISGLGVALLAVLCIGLVNTLIKPWVFLLTLPLTLITFGLFSIVINALMLYLVSRFVPGFAIDSFGAGLLGAFIYWLLTGFYRRSVQH